MTTSNQTPEEPLGDGGQHLHDWAFGADEMNRRFLERAVEDLGVVIAGCRTYDRSVPWWGLTARAGWARRPVFVVPHGAPMRLQYKGDPPMRRGPRVGS